MVTTPRHSDLPTNPLGFRSSIVGWLSAMLLAVASSGCRPSDTIDPPPTANHNNEPALCIAFVDEDRLAEPVSRRWTSEGHQEIKVDSLSAEQLEQAKFNLEPQVDVIVFPVAVYGDLIAAGQLLEIDEKSLPKDVAVNRNNFLGQYRANLVRFGNQTLALPLGGPISAVFYRPDLQPAGVPLYWSELNQRLANSPGSDMAKWLEPLAGDWAAHSFLTRLASRIRYPGKISTLFDLNSTRALIDTEPFVEALTEMAELHRLVGTREFLTPAEVFVKFRTGKAEMAACWPWPDGDNEKPEFPVAVARLPTTASYFDANRGTWTQRQGLQQRVEYLGSEGRLVAISANSLHANEAIAFASWLTSNQTGLRVLAESPMTGPLRLGHLASVRAWTKGSLPDDAVDGYAEIIRQIHEEEICLTFPRIPQRREFLETLGSAVRDAIAQRTSPQEALSRAAAEWDRITREIGVDRQREMLRKTEGLLIGKIEE